MHEHSEGHARQSFRVTGAWRFRNGGEEEEEGGCSGGGNKKDLVVCKEVKICWMWCGGG